MELLLIELLAMELDLLQLEHATGLDSLGPAVPEDAGGFGCQIAREISSRTCSNKLPSMVSSLTGLVPLVGSVSSPGGVRTGGRSLILVFGVVIAASSRLQLSDNLPTQGDGVSSRCRY